MRKTARAAMKKQFKQFVLHQLKMKGLKNAYLAKRMGLSNYNVRAMLNGPNTVTSKTANRFCKALKLNNTIDINYLHRLAARAAGYDL